jgi:hypothetical protein
MATRTELTTKFTDVNVSQLNFTDFEENTRSKGQKISYPRYNSTGGFDLPLFIQFPWIDLKSYGVPRLGDYYSDDIQRSFVKIPLDESVSDVNQLIDLLKNIDEKLGSDEFKQKMFGSKASKYVYQPIFRHPMEEDSESKKKETKKDYGPKQPYMKLKIDTTYPDNQVKTILFNSILKNGKRVRTKIEGVSTIDDFATYVCWKSRIRPIVRPVKLWAQAPNKKDPTYGLTFKIAKTEVEPPNQPDTSNVKKYMESDSFLDSDVESDTNSGSAKQKSPILATIKGKEVVNLPSDDSDEESSDSDDNIKPVKPKAKQVEAKQVIESAESDESDESEEDIKPIIKKPTSKSSKN